MLELAGVAFAKIGIAGFAGLWIVKAVAGVFVLRWLRDWNERRKEFG